jgi:phosphopantetheine adenylyltransferase
LLNITAEAIDTKPGARDLAALVKQYREILAEIDNIRGGTGEDDEISQIINAREADGKSGAVRQNRS